MQKFIASTIASIAAAQSTLDRYDWAGDEEFHTVYDPKMEIGEKHVDKVVDDPYTLSGHHNVHGTEECEHAIGHDGTYEYLRLITDADGDDYANCSGDYIESTKFLNGKPIYVNQEAERFIGWSTESWVLTATSYEADIFSGAIASPFGGFHSGPGAGMKPDSMSGYSMSYELDMDLEPEWRCLMRPLLRKGVVQVEEAELSIQSKQVLEEKAELILVHERLVAEAEARLREADCMELIERAMARLEECELAVLRRYVSDSPDYPGSWTRLLHQKTDCVHKFSEETATCNHLYTKHDEQHQVTPKKANEGTIQLLPPNSRTVWKSPNVQAPETFIEFTNKGEMNLRLVWMNFAGEPLFYQSIDAGATIRQQTYVGHVWRLTNTASPDTALAYFDAVAQPCTLEFAGF